MSGYNITWKVALFIYADGYVVMLIVVVVLFLFTVCFMLFLFTVCFMLFLFIVYAY